MGSYPKSSSILIVDDIDPVFINILKEAGHRVDYRPDISMKETTACISKYDALVLRSKFKVEAEFLNQCPRLKVIARAGAGVDNIDVQYAQKLGIELVSAPEGNCNAVAEHMLGMLLVLLHNLRIGDLQVRSGQWLREENRGVELQGRTAGLIGYGNNGRAMAKKLSGMGVKVLAYDKYLKNYSDSYAKQADMEELYREADVLSLHIPLTGETHELITTEFLARFHKPIFFLNGARGEIVRIKDVLAAMESQRVLGAAFDVLPVEKFPALKKTDWYAELIQNPRVVLTPHVAGWTKESYYKIAKVLGDKLVKALSNH